MKKSDIEKQLKKDLSTSTPSNFDDVWNKCSTPAVAEKEYSIELEQVNASASGTDITKKSNSRNINVAAVAVFVALCIIGVICMVLLLKPDGGLFLPSDSGYFLIDINPSIRVDYDTNGVVTGSQGLNADGVALLDGLQLDGLTYDKAADAIFDRCEERGYFTNEREDNAMLMTASNSNGVKDDKMTAELNKLFSQKFADKQMKGAVISDVDNEKHKDDAAKYNINGQKYELIMRYVEMGGTLDESQYETISVRELYSLISKLEKENSKDK